jgi:hypothetical protein
MSEEERYMFVYEDDGKYYKDIKSIPVKEGKKIRIHPVYLEGYIGNMSSEEAVWSEKDKKYKSLSEEGSWLDVIYSTDKNIKVSHTDLDNVVLYEGYLYHCDGDLLSHLVDEEPESLSLL